MPRLQSFPIVRWGSTAVTLFAVMLVALPARAVSEDGHGVVPIGRVDLDFPDAPAATVEIDLKEGLLSTVSDVGKAAIQGVIEGLLREEHGNAAVQQSAEHLQAANELFDIARSVICEVRVRVYDQPSEQTQETLASMVEHYQSRLDESNWDSVVRVYEGDSGVGVRVLQGDGAIHGVFVTVSERDELIMVNVVCELTPDKVQQVTSRATQIGMKIGLEDLIQQAIEQMGSRRH